MEKYSFPILRMDVIKEELKVFPNLEITIDDLKFPKQEKVKEMYVTLLEEVGINMDDINQMQFKGSENIQNPELHEKSIPLATIEARMRWLMSQIGVSDFYFMDVALPDPKRLKRNLSALINFWKFVESQRPVFNEILERKEQRSNKKALMLDKIDNLKKEINRFKIKQQEDAPVIKHHEDNINEICTSLSKAKKVQQKLNKEIQSLKTEAAEIMQSIVDAELKINQEQEEKVRLEALLVKSPDRIGERYESLIKEIEAAKERIQQKNNRLQEIQFGTENYKCIFIEVQCIKNILEMIHELYNREKELKMETQVAENKKYLLQTTFNQKMMDIERLEKILMSKKEQLMGLEMQHKSRMQAIEGMKQELEKEEEQLSLQKSQDEVVRFQLIEDIQKMKDAIVKIQQKGEANKKELEQQYNILLKEVMEKTKVVEEMLDNIVQQM